MATPDPIVTQAAKRTERYTAGAHVRAENATTLTVASAIKLHTAGLAVSLTVPDYAESYAYSQADKSHRDLSAALALLLFLGRVRARAEGRAALGAALNIAQWGAVVDSTAADNARARTSGASLAAQWSAAVLGTIANTDPADRPAALIKLPPQLTARVERTVSTETTQAFGLEREELARSTGLQLWSVWSAILDRRVCGYCESLDGQMATTGGTYGVWPGVLPPVHPMCRCLVLYVRR